MLSGFSWPRRTVTTLFAAVILFIFYTLPPKPQFGDHGAKWRSLPWLCQHPSPPPPAHDQDHENEPRLPPEYGFMPDQPSFCVERFGQKYLENLRDASTGYCTPDSPSNLTCFQSQTAPHLRTDLFCYAGSAALDLKDKKIRLACKPRNMTEETSRGVPGLEEFPSYWYETGPRHIFNNFIELDNGTEPRSASRNFTILVKREGSHNPWHSLMEIFSLTLTLDVLRMTRDPATGAAFFSVKDIENTQILILDGLLEGPFFDLWTLFAKRPVIKLADVSEGVLSENVIIPLPGGSNPLWQGDWEIHRCEGSDLLRTFSRRVLEFYQMDYWTSHDGPLVVTFIDRKETRRLMDQGAYLDELRLRLPNTRVESVDFAAIPLAEQLKIIQKTDVLVGVHGAGLTHSIFLHPGSAIVEILPADMNHKGFRNVAGLLGHGYFSAHASTPPVVQRDEWHGKDVFLEKDRFIGLVEVAVKSIYNKGSRNYDVN